MEFCAAAAGGDLERVKEYLSKGADINQKAGIYSRATLHEAARCGKLPVVQHLLENNADLNMKDIFGRTPCIYAAINGQTAVVQTLLQLGADPDVVDEDGKTALMWAQENGHQEVLKILQSPGATADHETGQVELTEKVDGKYMMTSQGVQYRIEEKDVTLSVPTTDYDEDNETTDTPISLAFSDPSERFTEENKPECHSEVLSLEPYGKCFDDYLIIKIPIQDQHAGKDGQLILNPSDDKENPKWVVVPKNHNTYNKSSYVISDEVYYYIFTKHLCQYVVGNSAELPVPFEVVTAVFACYNEAACELSFTVAFTCACHKHNYDVLTSKDTKKKYGNLLLEPFSILVDKSHWQPITVDTNISSHGQAVDWEEILNEREQPCGILGHQCHQANINRIQTVKSMFEPKNNVLPSMRVKISITIKQLETWEKQSSVKLAQLIAKDEPSRTEKKRLCLCVLPACVKKRGKIPQGTTRAIIFSKGYLQNEYQMFCDSLDRNPEKYELLLHKYYKVKVEKNNPVRKEAAMKLFKDEAMAKKGWGCLWRHLKEIGWEDALEVFEFVYERHQLLKRCDNLKKHVIFSHIKEDVLKLGIVPQNGVDFIKESSGKGADKVDYLIKHVLLEDRSYQNMNQGLKQLRSFNKILNVRYNKLVRTLICWP